MDGTVDILPPKQSSSEPQAIPSLRARLILAAHQFSAYLPEPLEPADCDELLHVMEAVVTERDAIIAELKESIAGLKKQTHQPTVHYWQNLYVQMQQEAKKRFDDWFVLKQQLTEATYRLDVLEPELKACTARADYAEQQLAERQADDV